MRRKIKELTPCHAKSIQKAITVPWQQMKTCRPSLDGGTAGSLVFTARLTGRKAPRGCYGNRLIICREGLSAATASRGRVVSLQEIRLTLMRTWPRSDGQYRFALWGIWKKMEIDVLTSVSVCACACTFFLVGPTKPREWWCNMPAIHQTRLSTCGLTLSLQLLKYVVSNYWNMYATSVPRNTFSLAFSHPASQPRVLQHQQI